MEPDGFKQYFEAMETFVKFHLETFGAEYPKEVQEAYGVLQEFAKILASIEDDNAILKEDLFSKLPREKVKEALAVIDAYQTPEEIRQDRKERERNRRMNLDTWPEARKLSENNKKNLEEHLDPETIKRAMDELLTVREELEDRPNEKGLPVPSELFESLGILYQKAQRLSTFEVEDDEGLFDIAFDLDDQLFNLRVAIEKACEMIEQITDLAPDPDEEWEEVQEE